MAPIELVVFDIAGTTVYDGDAVNVCLRAALDAAGVSVSRDEVNEVMGLPKPYAIRALMERRVADPTSVSEARVAATHDDFVERMVRHYRSDPSVHEAEGASETFHRLRAAGIKVGLDTGFDRRITDVLLERMGWARDGLIDVSVTSDEVARGRPHPDLICRAMELSGVADAGRVAKVGDTPADLEEGTAAGCGYVVGVTSGSHTREQLEPLPHTHLIFGLGELLEVLGLAQC